MTSVQYRFGFYEVVGARGRVISTHADWFSAHAKSERLNRRTVRRLDHSAPAAPSGG